MIIMNDRKRHVLLIAQRLFVEKGFLSTSIQDILEESQISKGTFYNYFSSKNECLMAILENGRNETIIRRREILIEQSLSDKNILVEQISIRQQVNRDYNLLPIFEAVFHSGDPDLSAFAKKHHLAEISWLTERLVDVYGVQVKPHAPDCAILLMGMLQHMSHVLMARPTEDIDSTELVKFIMRRMDSIIPDVVQTKDQLLPETVFSTIDAFIDHKTKKQLLTMMTDFSSTLSDEESLRSSQYIEFIIDELNAPLPRTFLLETVTRSFREAFIDTPHETESEKIAAALWKYFDTLKK